MAVYAASLAMYARLNPDGTSRPPTLQQLAVGDLMEQTRPRPTPPNQTTSNMVYGRR